MKTYLQFLGAKVQPIWRSQIETQLKRFGAVASVSAASVSLEQRREMKPQFCLRVLLAVPGPDIHAEARAYTFQAALLRVIHDLLRQIKTRKLKQLRGRHGHHLRNWTGTLVHHRA